MAACLAAGNAGAVTITLGGTAVTGQGIKSSQLVSYEETFDQGAGVCGTTTQLGIPFTTTSDYDDNGGVVALKGNKLNRYSAPAGDTSCYLSAGFVFQNNYQIIVNPAGADYVGLYWGTLDDYNSIAFLDSVGTFLLEYTGTDIAVMFGAPLLSSQYVNFAFDASEIISSLSISSYSNYAFELDNLAVHARYSGQVFIQTGGLDADERPGAALASIVALCGGALVAYRQRPARRA